MLTDVNACITDYQDQMLRNIQGQHATSDVQHYDQAYPFAVRAVALDRCSRAPTD